MQFRVLFLITSLFLSSSFQAFPMELTQQENSGGVADELTELTPVQVREKLIVTANDSKLFEYIQTLKLYTALDQKIDKANNYAELNRIQKEIIAIAAHYKHINVPFDIANLKRKLDAKMMGNLKALQELYNNFNNSLSRVFPHKTIDIEHAQGNQVEKRKKDMLWRSIKVLNIDSFAWLRKHAQLLFNELAKVTDLNNTYYKGRTPLTYLASACWHYNNFDIIKLLLEHGADPFKKDNNGVTLLERANQSDLHFIFKLLISPWAIDCVQRSLNIYYAKKLISSQSQKDKE